MRNFFVIVFLIYSVSADSQILTGDGIPVRVNSFDASPSGNTNQLRWSVSCFVKYANFLLERSSDGVRYTAINTFHADNVRCRLPFDFDDPIAGGKVFYRLSVGDLDGNFSTSKVVAVFGRLKGFDITAMAPTVVPSSSQISISSASADKVQIYVTNMQGVTVLHKLFSLVKGSNSFSLDLSSLSKGTFTLSCVNSENGVKSIRFVKL